MDPNRDRIIARSNHLSTLHRHQNDVFECEVWFPLSGVPQVFQNLNYNLPRRLSDEMSIHQSHQKWFKLFSSYHRVTRRQVMRHVTREGIDEYQNEP